MNANDDREKQLLRHLFHRGPATRTELAEALGLRRNTVGDLCAMLLKSNMLHEMDTDRRRNVRLALRPDFLHAIGVQHMPDEFHVAVMDAACAVRVQSAVDVRGLCGAARCEALGREIESLLRREGLTGERVAGIGFADLAIIDPARGRSVRSAHIPGWSDIPTCEILAQATGLPTWLIGFTDAVAVMELRAIAEPGWETALCVWLDRAIGLAVFADGRPLRGNHSVFGEMGHIVLDPMGSVCRCGNRGCLETIAATGAVIQRVERGIAQGAEFHTDGGEIAMGGVLANAKQGNRLAVRVLDEAAGAVGRALAIAVNLFGISRVLLFGELMKAEDVVIGPIQEAVRRGCVAPINVDVTYRISAPAPLRAAEGAAYMAFLNYFCSTSDADTRRTE
ncbi:MAG: ROK family transcriptional regulator [Planctomycetota bacterium]